MTLSTQVSASGGHHANIFSGAKHGFVSALATFGEKARVALNVFQVARTMSALSNMTNEQLAQIGIKRSDIPDYAETLIADR